METAHLIAFNLALLAALISPGPGMLVALRATLAEGRRAGVLTGMGLGAMAAGWTGLALLGLDVVFTAVPWAYLALKLIEKKVQGQEITEAPAEEPKAQVIDLMEALKASLSKKSESGRKPAKRAPRAAAAKKRKTSKG